MRSTDCWCRECHAMRLDVFQDDNLEILKGRYLSAKNEEKQALKDVFTQVLNVSAISKMFRLKLERFSGYKYVKPYFKQLGYEDKDAETFSRSINEASWVYDNLHRIIHNVEQFKCINLRRLSIRQLYLAKDFHWCLRYAQDQKGRGKKPEDPVYDEDDFQDLTTLIRNSAAYVSLEKDPKLITALLHRLQKNLVQNP